MSSLILYIEKYLCLHYSALWGHKHNIPLRFIWKLAVEGNAGQSEEEPVNKEGQES